MTRMIRYRVKADRAAENERYIREVFGELASVAPGGVHYASFKLKDGLTFVHLVSFESEEGAGALRALPAFRSFTEGVRERCDQPPVTTELAMVGAYSFFGA
jgi:hypothetical protein